ncbi:hypothetical protein [Streptomyces sp. NRRL S-495]|uniref:hypothetical protein n=1 Tax=Streptomyces sp. NRRL S-495 TaxID=1609133 RepID=UPI000698550E|nr:hypothetical protein [Streptomyces sp. NRRL S-495]
MHDTHDIPDLRGLLARLPDPASLRDRCRGLAMLEAILGPDWEDRYYSFASTWGAGEETASMRNGEGDDWFMVFSDAGVYARGLDRTAPNAAPQLLPEVPGPFRAQAEEPAFGGADGVPLATVCFWHGAGGDDGWQAPSAAPTGGVELFALLAAADPARAYLEWAEEYYEPEHAPEPAAVAHVLALHPLTAAVVAAIDPDVELADLAEDIAAIGYPTT